MISTRDEFVLLLAKWKNSSAKVTALLVHGGSTSSNPLSSAFISMLPFEVTGIDDKDSFFVLGDRETGTVSVGFEGAEFHFETAADLEPYFAVFVSESATVDEMVTIVLPSGLILSLSTFK